MNLSVPDGGNIAIAVGSDYLTAIGNALQWPTYGNWPADLTGAVIALQLWIPGVGLSYTFTGAVSVPTGNQLVRVELTHAQTSAITPRSYTYAVVATLTGTSYVVTLVKGLALVTSP